MTPEQIDQEIQSTQEGLDCLNRQMDSLKDQFIAETAKAMEPWYMKQAGIEAERRPDITEKIGKEGIAKLKRLIEEVQRNTQEHVSQELQNVDLWWHLKPGNQSYSYYGHRSPDELHKAIRRAAGKIAPVLADAGYISIRPQESGAWLEYDQSGNRHTNVICYPGL